MHPDRDAIEGDFIRWRSPELIAREYKIANRTSIYRHAHCTGLSAWRRRELGRVLEGMLENAEHIPLEASDAIVRAARVYAHLDENGNWFEPARINFVLTGPAPAISRPESFPPASSTRRRKFRSAAPNLAARVLAAEQLSLVNKIAFVAHQLLLAVTVLTATVDLQKKGQVDEYKGESKFLIATNSPFSAIARLAVFYSPRYILVSRRPVSGSLASSPRFPYPTTAQLAEIR